MSQRIVQVDAFTDRPFAGNPAGVCVLPGPADERWMQRLAGEMNLAETAFLYPQGEAFQLRWFTPTIEMDLCGHATLASAHVLWEDGILNSDETARFDTRSGRLTATRRDGLIWMDFPALAVEPVALPDELRDALSVTPRFTGRGRFDYLLELESPEQLRALIPDLAKLAALAVRGVIITAASDDPEFDIVSRFFAPAAGVPEDPVTGSAHCSLATYWPPKLGRTAFTAYQASPRGGTVRVRLDGERALLGGQAITVLRGELTIASGPDGEAL